jgi:hypothetical protein
MRALVPLFTAVLLLGCASVVEPRIEEPKVVDFSGSGTRSRGCQGGCTLVRDPRDAPSPARVEAFLREIDQTPVGSESEALDNLLFHDEEARVRLAAAEPLPVSPAWDAFLRKELARREATFGLRIIDEQGQVRAQVPDTAMALGRKLHMQVDDGVGTGSFNANGTLVRVSRDRLWIRM